MSLKTFHVHVLRISGFVNVMHHLIDTKLREAMHCKRIFKIWDPIQSECNKVFSLPSPVWALMFYELPSWLNLQSELLIVPFFKRKWNTLKKLSNQCKIVENCNVPATLEWRAAWQLSRLKTKETITPFHSYYYGISTTAARSSFTTNSLSPQEQFALFGGLSADQKTDERRGLGAKQIRRREGKVAQGKVGMARLWSMCKLEMHQGSKEKIKTLDMTSAKPARQHRASAGSLGSVHLNELVYFWSGAGQLLNGVSSFWPAHLQLLIVS